jgi:hypothetical protein
MATDEDVCLMSFERSLELAQKGLIVDPEHEGLQDIVDMASGDGEESVADE